MSRCHGGHGTKEGGQTEAQTRIGFFSTSFAAEPMLPAVELGTDKLIGMIAMKDAIRNYDRIALES